MGREMDHGRGIRNVISIKCPHPENILASVTTHELGYTGIFVDTSFQELEDRGMSEQFREELQEYGSYRRNPKYKHRRNIKKINVRF